MAMKNTYRYSVVDTVPMDNLVVLNHVWLPKGESRLSSGEISAPHVCCFGHKFLPGKTNILIKIQVC